MTTLPIKPQNGGFQRLIRTTDFILRFLKGEGPEGEKRIDPRIGAPMVDIFFEYKNALFKLFAREKVELEEEKQIRLGKPAYTQEEYSARLEYYLSRIPSKFFRMRYSSFTRYFGHLVRLGWVVKTGFSERSSLQNDYPPAPSRIYYKITEKGRKATEKEIADPIQTLYHYSRSQRSAKRSLYYKS
jgi:hypothetical protein